MNKLMLKSKACEVLYIFILLFSLFFTDTAKTASSDLQIVFPAKTQTFTLLQLKEKLKVHSITVFDPIYQKEKTFSGFLLTDVLSLMGPLPTDANEIAFSAIDGYSPTVSIKSGLSYKSYVVFGEANNSKNWEPILQGKQLVSPAPFYLVWPNQDKALEHFPRPYQLVKIELVKFSQKFSKMFPTKAKSSSKAYRGFNLFRQRCLRCHTVNLQGGHEGPELNIPKNVTEYWSTNNLKQFIRAPESFRLGSKMNSNKDLSVNQVEDLVAYLKAMRNNKIFPK